MHEPEEKPATSSKRPRSRTLGRIVLEVFSIVLGVLLALGVSEWQEQRDNEARAATALANVRAELQSNLDLLNIIYPINSRIVDRLSSGRENDSDDESLVPGVQLRSSAWQTLGSTGLSNYVDYKLLIGLSQLYSMIDVYRQSAFSFISSNMDMAATATALGSNIDNDLYSKNFLPYFQLLVQIESALIDVHQKAIESIDLQQSHVKQ
jgi:type II secretory pathway pseudopilin PulG